MGARDPVFSARGRQAKEVSDIGGLIGERYRIEGLIREDATTSTVSATHLALEERVAVQVLRAEPRFDQQLTVQYLQAIKALARIKTDHVVRVLDVGVALFLGPFMVMEDLEGSTLREVLRAEGPLRLPRAVDYVLQACKGLSVAHAAGLVHGRLDTGRLLLARRGEFETLKVIDFPTLARSAERSAEADGAARSAPGYLAPEVLSGAVSIDRRADVWSLGAVLCELVTGRPELAPDDDGLSPALRQIIARCLQPDPAQRFSEIDALAAELLPLTTLNEVFRGSLTGSFSRQRMMAAAAQARAEARSRPSAPLRAQAWRERLARARSALRELDGQARWRALEQSWNRVAPEGPSLQRALTGAGGAALIGLGCAWLGRIQLIPPPRPGPAALSVVSAALAAPAASRGSALELGLAVTPAETEPPQAVPATVEHTTKATPEARPAAKRAMRVKSRRARRRQ